MSNDLYMSIIVVCIAYCGILINRKNMIFLLVQLEMIYNGILLVFITGGYSYQYEMSVSYFLIILALMAAEAVVGLVLTILYFKAGRDINLSNLSSMHG